MPNNLTTNQSGSDDNTTALVPETINDEWFQQLEIGQNSLFDIAIDDNKNVYLAGNGELTGIGAGSGQGSWIAKYDSTGIKLWASSVDVADNEEPSNIVANKDGNVFLTGHFSTYEEEYDYTVKYPFVVKYDSSGNEQWQQQLELNPLVHSVTDSAGNLYIAGTDSAGPSGPYNFTIAKYNSSGGLEWMQKKNVGYFVPPHKDYDLTVDDAGNVYFVGNTDNGSSITGFIAKYDSGGNLQWEQDGEVRSTINSVAVDSDGSIYTTANVEIHPFLLTFYLMNPDAEPEPTRTVLAKYDSSGNLQWRKEWEDANLGMELDGEGNVYVPVTEGVHKYDGEGNLVWEQEFTSTLSSYSDFELDGDGQAYLVGGELDSWLAKVDINAGAIAIVNNGLTLDEGETTTITSSELTLESTDSKRVVYTITGLPTNGILKLNEVELALNDGFTQADIDAGSLTYTHDGSEQNTNDIFNFASVNYSTWVETEGDFQIAVNPVNDAPTEITLSQNSIAENSVTGTVIAQLTTADSDSDIHSYTLVDDAEGRFVIEGNELKVADGSKLDFEATTNHTITVRTTDSGEPNQSFEKEFSIEVTDVEDNTVTSTTNHRLEATKKNLNLTGKDSINGIGNNLDNRISANNAKNRIRGQDGNDVIKGRGGNDVLIGDKGSDRLYGNRGNDFLNGGPGIDTLSGGSGNDTYIANHRKDVVTEAANRGKDVVKSSASYNLSANIENLNLIGKDAIAGTGNNLNNRISGNNAKNRLRGKGGKDVLIGRGGNDILIGDNGSDRLIGNRGNDLLNGDVGNDTLIGGGGSDRFIFNTGKSFRQSSPGKDVIRDFKNGDNDKILLDKTTFGALHSKAGNGFSVIEEFDAVKSDRSVATSDAVIVYNENNGKLFYNANGSNDGLGVGGVFAVLDNTPQLQANDFIIRG